MRPLPPISWTPEVHTSSLRTHQVTCIVRGTGLRIHCTIIGRQTRHCHHRATIRPIPISTWSLAADPSRTGKLARCRQLMRLSHRNQFARCSQHEWCVVTVLTSLLSLMWHPSTEVASIIATECTAIVTYTPPLYYPRILSRLSRSTSLNAQS